MSEFTIGEFLKSLRHRDRLTLRQVEKLSEGRVSNAYLSQIETGKIKKPSPKILFALATVFKIPYDRLMDLAGHPSARGSNENIPIITNVFSTVSEAEARELTNFLGYLRSKK